MKFPQGSADEGAEFLRMNFLNLWDSALNFAEPCKKATHRTLRENINAMP